MLYACDVNMFRTNRSRVKHQRRMAYQKCSRKKSSIIITVKGFHLTRMISVLIEYQFERYIASTNRFGANRLITLCVEI